MHEGDWIVIEARGACLDDLDEALEVDDGGDRGPDERRDKEDDWRRRDEWDLVGYGGRRRHGGGGDVRWADCEKLVWFGHTDFSSREGHGEASGSAHLAADQESVHGYLSTL